MDTSNLKNMVVLKDLPSNLIEEAIVVLKENQRIEKLQLAEKEGKNKKEEQDKNSTAKKSKNSKDYIIQEAQMLIADYIYKIEHKNKKDTQSIQNLKHNNKKLKMWNGFLLVSLLFSILFNFIA